MSTLESILSLISFTESRFVANHSPTKLLYYKPKRWGVGVGVVTMINYVALHLQQKWLHASRGIPLTIYVQDYLL